MARPSSPGGWCAPTATPLPEPDGGLTHAFPPPARAGPRRSRGARAALGGPRRAIAALAGACAERARARAGQRPGRRPRRARRAARASGRGRPTTSPCARCATPTPSPRPTSGCAARWPSTAATRRRARPRRRAEAWRPWRAYAALHLWQGLGDDAAAGAAAGDDDGGRGVKPVVIIEQDAPLVGRRPRAAAGRGAPACRCASCGRSTEPSRRVDLDEVAGARADRRHAARLGRGRRTPTSASERRLLAAAHARDVPILGICLGGQVLARALGAEVGATERPERGMHDVEVLPAAADDPVLGRRGHRGGRVYQWHLDAFDLPDGATLLARSPGVPRCRRSGTAARGALQFHPEVDAPSCASGCRASRTPAPTPASTRPTLRAEVDRREEPRRRRRSRRAWSTPSSRLVADRARHPGARPAAPCAAPAAP